MKPSSVEPGQVWVLETVGVEDHPLEQPVFEGTYLVLRTRVLPSRKAAHELGEQYTVQALGIMLDERVQLSPDEDPELDGLVWIDYPENLLHEGERLHADSSHRWRFVA